MVLAKLQLLVNNTILVIECEGFCRQYLKIVVQGSPYQDFGAIQLVTSGRWWWIDFANDR